MLRYYGYTWVWHGSLLVAPSEVLPRPRTLLGTFFTQSSTVIRPQLEGVINRLTSPHPSFCPRNAGLKRVHPSIHPSTSAMSHLASIALIWLRLCLQTNKFALSRLVHLSLSHQIVHIKHYQLVACSLLQIHHSVYPRMHTPYGEWTNGRFTTHATSIIPSLPVRLHPLISSQYHLYHHRHHLQHVPAWSSSMYCQCWLDHTQYIPLSDHLLFMV